PVTVATIPPELKRDWVAPDGRARVQVLPKGDPEDTAVLRKFVPAVLAVEPDATGPAAMLYEAGNTIVRAFIEAGIFALAAIALLLWITLRRVTDVLMTLVPLLLAAVVTLELCVVLDLPLNFANIIALPLLLGVGVALKIYYIMAWRRGRTALVQSTLTRAVIFSAMTTATAFGSLWLSRHPGTSSMGELMALALLCTMMAAVLFQPALMGPPREVARDEPTYLWVSFPFVDPARFMGFDLFCAWLDVFLMSFFFMLSGLFVWPSLQRKGAWTFFSDRLLRIGVPFLVVAFLLMPVAQYPT